MTRASARLRVLALAGATAVAIATLAAPPAGAAPAPASRAPSWRLVDTGGTNHFRGLSVVSRNVVWLGGYNGQVLRTIDGGQHWRDFYPDGTASTLQFRDIQAFDANHAVAMAAGETTDSRLYSTFDGGQHWRLAYENTDADRVLRLHVVLQPRRTAWCSATRSTASSASCPPATAGRTGASTPTAACPRPCPARPASPPAASA